MSDIETYPLVKLFKGSDKYLIVRNGQTSLISGTQLEAMVDGKVIDEFIGLSDAPGTYVGEAGKVVAVKSTEDGVEFIDITQAQTLIGLSDTPVAYALSALKSLRVNAAADAVEFFDDNFLLLNDTPADYSGQALKFLQVNAGENALEFTDPAGIANTVVIVQESDFPTASGGVIPLAANTTYLIKDSFSLANALSFANAGSVIAGDSLTRSKITFTGTGQFIRSAGENVTCRNISVLAATQTLLGITGDGTTQVSFNNCELTFLQGGTVATVAIFVTHETSFFHLGAVGLAFSGTCNTLAMDFTRNQDINATATKFIDLGSSTWEAISLNNIQFISTVAAIAVEGLPSNGNLTTNGRAIFANCFVQGSTVAVSGITIDDNKWRFVGNVGVQDSKAIAFGYISVPDTTDVLDGSYVPIAGTWTQQAFTSRAVVASNGEVTLSNLETQSFTISVTLTAVKVSGSVASYTFQIQQDSGSGFVAIEGANKTVNVSTVGQSITVFGLTEAITGHKLRIAVQGNGTADDIDVDVSQFLIES